MLDKINDYLKELFARFYTLRQSLRDPYDSLVRSSFILCNNFFFVDIYGI